MINISLAVLVPHYCAEPVAFSKREAVHLIAATRLASGNGRGKGSAARRRLDRQRAQFEAEADAATAQWFDEQRLTQADIDQLAERHSEARRPHYHDLPIAQNFHDL